MAARPVRAFITSMLLSAFGCGSAAAQFVSQKDVARLTTAPADHRIAYGSSPLQFGELRLPGGEGPHPLAIVIHGGCWLSAFADLQLMAPLADALTRAGIATWNIEFRSVDNTGGGWPGTFVDVANAVDHTRELAAKYALDLQRVIIIGHSAGGHLALWAAARRRLPQSSPLFISSPLPVRGVVSLAGISNLRTYPQESPGCGKSVPTLVGGSPSEVPERYRDASPIEMLPLGVKQTLIVGAHDTIVRPQHVRAYATEAQKRGDDVQLLVLDGAAHFEVIAPNAAAWQAIEASVRSMLDAVRK